MPEIAEVELVRRGLEPLVGQRLERVLRCEERLGLAGQAGLVSGRRVERTLRHGKLLGLALEGDLALAFHLRMTGRIFLGPSPAPAARAAIAFSSTTLSFSDPRGFGTLEAMPLKRFGAGLGPDLFELERGRFASTAPAALGRSRRAVKALLLDQTRIAGIGNYLADEALWEQRVAPQAPASSIDPGRWAALLGSARDLAERVLEAGGVSLRDYVRVDGSRGGGQALLRCYGRTGQPCLRCGAELAKSRVAGRGTTSCPVCQGCPS